MWSYSSFSGVPKIEVTFDVDANGILNVTAVEHGTGAKKQVTITNDKGRLSKEDIDRMLADAEKYKAEDEIQRQRVTARNNLESYIFSISGAVREHEEKLTPSDKQTVEAAVKETTEWLDMNALAEKEEYDHKKEELEKTCSPIMTKLYSSAGSQENGSHSSPQAHRAGPTVEEMD